MAKMSHHGSCRSKCSTEFKCICFERGNRRNDKRRTRQCETYEIRVFIEVETKQQCKNLLKTTKLLGYLPVKVSPHKTLNSSKFVIKCEELGKMDEEEIKKELQPQGIIAVKKNFHTIQSVRFNHQRTNYLKKDQYWVPEKRNTTVHSQPSKMFSMPEIWTHQEFM